MDKDLCDFNDASVARFWLQRRDDCEMMTDKKVTKKLVDMFNHNKEIADMARVARKAKQNSTDFSSAMADVLISFIADRNKVDNYQPNPVMPDKDLEQSTMSPPTKKIDQKKTPTKSGKEKDLGSVVNEMSETLEETTIITKDEVKQHRILLAPNDDEARRFEVWNKSEMKYFPTYEDELAQFEKDLELQRVAHEKTIDRKTLQQKVNRDVRTQQSGRPKTIPPQYLKSLESFPNDRKNDFRWIKKQIECFKRAQKFVQALLDAGFEPPRHNWTQHTRNDFETFISSILSANTRDTKLFHVVYAMRKLGIFDLESLANYRVRKLQNLFLYVGYNNW